MTTDYLIVVATYCRPVELQTLLDSIASDCSPQTAAVVVVDNDPAESGRKVAAEHPIVSTYVVEPRPGIAAARNRGLDHFAANFRALIFVDDDEWVEEGWLDALTSFAETSRAGAVQGAVRTLLPEDAPRWALKGGFYQRPILATGHVLRTAATNNTLLSRDAWERAGRPRFDDDYSISGGSDTDFFWRIRRSGVEIQYCADAIVTELVPRSRLTKRWVRRRYMRSGIVSFRVMKKLREDLLRAAARSVARGGWYSLVMLADILRGRGIRAQPLSIVLFEIGWFRGLFGYRNSEYVRSPR